MAHVRRQGACQVSRRPPRQQQQEGWIWRQRRHHQNSVDQLGSGLRRDIHTHEYFCKWNSETANIFMVEGEMPHKPPISFFQKKDANLMATTNRPSPFCAQRRCRWCPMMSAVASHTTGNRSFAVSQR